MVQVYELDPVDILHVQTKNKCWVRIVNDTLNINLFAIYSGVGVTLQVKNGNCIAQPFTAFAPDVVLIDENYEPPQIDIQSAKLVLDKMSYETGGSIFGHLYLRALVDETSKHYAQGYFRAKIARE